MSTKEIQEKLVENMKRWQKIEDASMASTGRIMEQTENPLIHLVMEVIQIDSQVHHRVQDFIASTFERAPVSITPEEISQVWEAVEQHIAIEKKMVGFVEETLSAIKGKKMVVAEYLLNYLRDDERKHDNLLAALEKVKAGMYPYG